MNGVGLLIPAESDEGEYIICLKQLIWMDTCSEDVKNGCRNEYER